LLLAGVACTGGGSSPGTAVPKGKDRNEPPASPGEEPKPKLSPAAKEAIDKGVAHLKKRLVSKDKIVHPFSRYPSDEPAGARALAGLALLEAGVAPADPAVQSALATVREAGPTNSMIYTIGAFLFFLNRLDEANALEDGDRELIRKLGLRLVGGQNADGGWGYANPPLTPEAEQTLLKNLKANTHKPTTQRGPSTNSMTQFALLALWGSRKHDIPIRIPVLAAAKRFHTTQNSDGTWDYDRNAHGGGILGKDSNTCAGLIALAMEKIVRQDKEFGGPAASDPPLDPKAAKQSDRAFVHLASVIGRTKDDPVKGTPHHLLPGMVFKADAWGDYYFLWCLERVAVIYNVNEIGGKDWYEWGSKVILETQKENGSWQERHGDVPDTCFALLFLLRANVVKDLTDKLRLLADSVQANPASSLPPRKES
jgi:hypothetical protein